MINYFQIRLVFLYPELNIVQELRVSWKIYRQKRICAMMRWQISFNAF